MVPLARIRKQQYDRKYYRKYLDNDYMKVSRPKSIGSGAFVIMRSGVAVMIQTKIIIFFLSSFLIKSSSVKILVLSSLVFASTSALLVDLSDGACQMPVRLSICQIL